MEANQRSPEERIAQLEKAIPRLEKLTRDCFELARNYWINDKGKDDKFRDLEHETAHVIARCLAELLYEKRGGKVFVAPRYRGTGTFTDKPGDASTSSLLLEKGKDPYASKFGRFAESNTNGDIIDSGETKQFMPVAFWNYHIYERPIQFRSADGTTHKIKISGFSGWTAAYGFLGRKEDPEREAEPIFGFHIKLNKNQEFKRAPGHGLLHFEIPSETLPFKFTETFREAFYDGKNKFYRGKDFDKAERADRGKHKFPLITDDNGTPISDQEILNYADKVFSTLFYSNFIKNETANLKSCSVVISTKHVDSQPPILVHDSIIDAVSYYFSEYNNAVKKAAGNILEFDHYYAFLLNPSFDFRNHNDRKQLTDSAVGTVNIYTETPIPPLLAALIRKNLESIYHFLREIEDWEEATVTGSEKGKTSAFKDMQSATGHELMHIYTGADNAITSVYEKNKSDNRVKMATNVVKSALSYGLLWGNSTHSLARSSSTTLNALVKEALQKSWEIFIGSHVLFTDADVLTDEQINYINNIWSLGSYINRFNIKDIDNAEISALLSILSIRQALFRWHLVAIVNALRHRIIAEDKGSLDIRLNKLIGQLNNDKIFLNYNISTLNQSITFLIMNDYDGTPSSKYPKMSQSTGLTLSLAAEEIEACLHQEGFKSAYIDPPLFYGIKPHWITSLTISGLNFS